MIDGARETQVSSTLLGGAQVGVSAPNSWEFKGDPQLLTTIIP